jgi:hypothetical protein
MEILTMAAIRKKSADLREACIREALAIIETEGVENLSLREVSRRLGISHQAPKSSVAPSMPSPPIWTRSRAAPTRTPRSKAWDALISTTRIRIRCNTA